MTEAEWLSDTNYSQHLRFVKDRLSTRQLRLLAAAFCRCVLRIHSEPAIVQSLEAAEEFADGNCTVQTLEAHRWQLREAAVVAHEKWLTLADDDANGALNYWLLSELAWATAYTASPQFQIEDVAHRAAGIALQAQMRDSGLLQPSFAVTPSSHRHLSDTQVREFRALVWDVAGNPFREPVDLSAWRTSTVVALARGMYRSRDFSTMPILADALEDAGCDDDEVLAHCRAPGVHLRGCWVVDQLLPS
jgi:hypothetical protein